MISLGEQKNRFFLMFTVVMLTFFPFGAKAVEIIPLPGIPVQEDYLVGPAKIEASVQPGTSRNFSFSITNRSGRAQKFSLSLEDYEGSSEPNQAVVFLHGDESATSLKDYIFLPQNEFTLRHGERAIVPFGIFAPAGASPGGRFSAVIVSATPTTAPEQSQQIAISPRIAVLLFVTIEGDVQREGQLVSIATKNGKSLFWDEAIPIQILFENNGNVHLNPYGKVIIRNMFGRIVEEIVLEPWFTLPNSQRLREIEVRGVRFGRYRVEAQINRGYEDLVDEGGISFVVLPITEVLVALVALAVLFSIRQVRRRKQ